MGRMKKPINNIDSRKWGEGVFVNSELNNNPIKIVNKKSQYMRQYYKKNRERLLKKAAEYRKKNSTSMKEYAKEYNELTDVAAKKKLRYQESEEYREHIKETQRAWMKKRYNEDPEFRARVRAYQNKYYQITRLVKNENSTNKPV